MKQTILVTGAVGFIGYHLCKRLISEDYNVIGVDNVNAYYDVDLKEFRLTKLRETNKFKFYKLDITDICALCDNVFKENKIDVIVHLAAQAGVRYSMENPTLYMESNVMGFFNILECSRLYDIKKLLYASSSSVYGDDNNTDKPISLYAATKKSNEILAYTYSHLYNIQTIGMRFFSVYGKLGRPDMAYFKFTKSILKNEGITLYNGGNMYRDFTYIDDVIESICRLLQKNAGLLYDIFDIGRGTTIKLTNFVRTLYNVLEKTGKDIGDLKLNTNYVFSKNDVFRTQANTEHLYKYCNYKPQTDIEEGLQKFVTWYVNYYD